MLRSHAKLLALIAFLSLASTGFAVAQGSTVTQNAGLQQTSGAGMNAGPAMDEDRDAAFLPPPSFDSAPGASQNGQVSPSSLGTNPSQPPQPIASPNNLNQGRGQNSGSAISGDATGAPSALQLSTEPAQQAAPTSALPLSVSTAPLATTPSTVPSSNPSTISGPVAMQPAQNGPGAAALRPPPLYAPALITHQPNSDPLGGSPQPGNTPTFAATSGTRPVDLGKSVEAAPLKDINPAAVGVIAPKDGLGTGIWDGTTYTTVNNLLLNLSLPTASAALNALADRLLLTTANVPTGTPSTGAALTSLRVNSLLMLGDGDGAWKLVDLADQEFVDDITLRTVAEAAMLGPQREKVCARLPELIKAHAKEDWQEDLVVCQLIQKDLKAAQVTLDLMHTQNIRDDNFFYLAERNVIAGTKELPRQLTPVRPVNLALLQLADLPLRGEVYAHPEADIIPALLAIKTKDPAARLSLAERAGEKGILSAVELEGIYAAEVFPTEALSSAIDSTEQGARLHALLYQATTQEVVPDRKISLSIKYMQSLSAVQLSGSQGHILADMVGSLPPSDAFNGIAGSVAKLYLLAGNEPLASAWIKQAKHASIGMPAVAASLQDIWPLIVVSGLDNDAEYPVHLVKWLDAILPPNDVHPGPKSDLKDENSLRRDRASSVLLILDAAGFAVPEDAWARISGLPGFERHIVPPALLLERLRAASAAGHKGETVLLALYLFGSSSDEPWLFATLASIRALRLAGLSPDAMNLAKEALTTVLSQPLKP